MCLVIDDGPVAIEGGRHPVVEVLRSDQFVVNLLHANA